MRFSFVYFMTNRPDGVLYCGVTADLLRRIAEHRAGSAPGFTRRYGLKTLVWFETHENVVAAIAREKEIKRWSRAAKVRLIHEANPDWRDLWPDIAA